MDPIGQVKKGFVKRNRGIMAMNRFPFLCLIVKTVTNGWEECNAFLTKDQCVIM